MWIIKPIEALSKDEAFLFSKFYELPNTPVAQTLEWGLAAKKFNQEIIVAFNLEMGIGGINLVNDSVLECVNGPLFDLKEDKYKIDQKVATYVFNLAQVYPKLKKIVLRPRMSEDNFSIFEQKSTFPFDEVEQFKTLIVDLEDYTKSKEAESVTKFQPQIEEIKLNEEFHQTLKELGSKKEFYVPPYEWFAQLLESPDNHFKLWVARTQFKDSYIVTTFIGDKVYYLFACENIKEKKNLSLNLYLIYSLFESYKKSGAKYFDFHGIEFSPDPESSFQGVNDFKSKFGGKESIFLVPELVFESE